MKTKKFWALITVVLLLCITFTTSAQETDDTENISDNLINIEQVETTDSRDLCKVRRVGIRKDGTKIIGLTGCSDSRGPCTPVGRNSALIMELAAKAMINDSYVRVRTRNTPAGINRILAFFIIKDLPMP